MIEMIVTDLDGTLLDRNKELSRYNQMILIEAQRRGISLVLATGRNIFALDSLADQLKMAEFKTGYLIGVNGLQLYDFKRATYDKEEILNVEQVSKIQRLLKRNDYSVFYFSDEKTVCGYNLLMKVALKSRIIKQKVRHIIASSASLQIEYVANGRVATLSQNKICFIAFNPLKLQKIKRDLETEFTLLQVGRHWIEIIPKNVSKANRLQTIIAQSGLRPDQIAVFGDSENDLEMLRMSPNAYVPVNGLGLAKKIATEIIPSNNRDGVGKIVSRLLNHPENQ